MSPARKKKRAPREKMTFDKAVELLGDIQRARWRANYHTREESRQAMNEEIRRGEGRSFAASAHYKQASEHRRRAESAEAEAQSIARRLMKSSVWNGTTRPRAKVAAEDEDVRADQAIAVAIVDRLNRLIDDDETGEVRNLLESIYENPAWTMRADVANEHPTLQFGSSERFGEPEWTLSFVGLLNGIAGAHPKSGHGYISVVLDTDEDGTPKDPVTIRHFEAVNLEDTQ